MEYLVSCSCGKEIAVTRSQAGQSVPCACGQSVQVPTLRGFADLKMEDSGQANDQLAEKPNAWKGWRGPAFATFAFLFIAAGLYSLYHVRDSYLYDQGYSVQDFIDAQAEELGYYGPDELVLLWENYRDIGLKEQHPPEFHKYNTFAEEQSTVAMVSGILAGVFAVCMVGVWVTTLGGRKS